MKHVIRKRDVGANMERKSQSSLAHHTYNVLVRYKGSAHPGKK